MSTIPLKYHPTNFASMRGDDEEAPAIEIKSWAGLYDEGFDATTYNINSRASDRHKCEFVNASLHWESEHHKREGVWTGWSLGANGSDFHPQWGEAGYGAIRLCKKCKHIDCLHVWEKSTKYVLHASDANRHVRVISTCKICKRRVVTNGYLDCSRMPPLLSVSYVLPR